MVDSIQANLWSSTTQDSQVSSKKHHRPDPEMMFKKIDTNGDGQISQDELTVFASKIEDKTGQKLDVEQMFKDYDKNQDGSLSQDELAAAMKSQMDKFQEPPPTGGANPKDLFNKVDQDEDGMISQSELKSFLSQVEKNAGQKLDTAQLLKSYDSDQDGSLNFDEFDSLMKNEIVNLMPPPANSDTSSPVQMQTSSNYQPYNDYINLFDITT